VSEREQVQPTQVRRAAGIYGLIVTASVLATAGTHLRTAALALAVIITVLVYWLAEEYAELTAHAHAGHLPTRADTRASFVGKWPMVSASYLPLFVLLVARAIGATPTVAALVGLVVTLALLLIYGWAAGRSAGLHGLAQIGMTLLAGSLGILMIVLKIVLLQLH
jgi:hypothetical protein